MWAWRRRTASPRSQEVPVNLWSTMQVLQQRRRPLIASPASPAAPPTRGKNLWCAHHTAPKFSRRRVPVIRARPFPALPRHPSPAPGCRDTC